MTVNSRLNIPTTKWPEAWWKQIFSIVIAYPKISPANEVIEDTRATLIGMRSTLPCGKCRKNWRNTIEKHPLTDRVMSSRDSLFKWLCDRYRDINKKRRSLSNSAIAEYYTNQLFEKTGLDTVNLVLLGALFGIGILVYLRLRH